MVQCDSCTAQTLSGHTKCGNCILALSPLHFDPVQSKSHPCCRPLPKGTYGTYRKSALFFQEKNFWPSRSELTKFAPDTTAPRVTQSPGSSISARFGQVKTDAKLVVLKKKAGPPMQELPHTVSAQQAGGVELEQPRTGAWPLDDAAILQRQAAALEQVIAKACQSSRSSRHANSPANAAANFSANQGFGPGSRGSQANHGPVGSQGGSQTKVAGSPSHSEVAPPTQTSPLIPDEDGGESGADPSFSLSEGQDSGDSPSESEGGGEESLFPHPPVPGASHRSGASHRVPQNQEPGDYTGPSYQFPLMETEEVDQRSQRSQPDDASSEVDLSLQPGQVIRPDVDPMHQELNPPIDPVFVLDLEVDPKKSSCPVDSQQASKSCDKQDLTQASGKGTPVPDQERRGRDEKRQLPGPTPKSTKHPPSGGKHKVDKPRGPLERTSSQRSEVTARGKGRGKPEGLYKTSTSVGGVEVPQSNLGAIPKKRASLTTGNLQVTDRRPSQKSKSALAAMELSITVPTVHPEGDQAVSRVVSASRKGQALDATDHHSGGLGRGRASQVSGHPDVQRSKSAGAKASKRRKGHALSDRSQERASEATSQWSLCPNLPSSQTEGLILSVSFAGVTQLLTFVPFFQGHFGALAQQEGQSDRLRETLCSLAADRNSKESIVVLPPLAIELIARSITQALRDFTERSLAALSSQAQSQTQQESMDTREAPLTKKQRRKAQQKAILREIKEQDARRGLPSQEDPPMAFGLREDPYADSSAKQSPHQQSDDCADQSQSHSEQAAAQVLLQPLTQVVGEFTKTLEADRDDRRSRQRHQPPVPGTSDPLGPFDLTPPPGYEVPGIYRVMTQEQRKACASFHNTAPTQVLPFKEGRSLKELSSQTLTSKQAEEFPDKLDDLAKDIWARMAQDVSDDPQSWESARTPGTAPAWKPPQAPEESEIPDSYHHDLDTLVTETPVESTKTYTGLPVSHRARRVLQHVAFGKDADKSSTLSRCVHLPKSDFKTCSQYSLTVSPQEEQILGHKQPVKAGKLESQDKVVSAIRDEHPYNKEFFADSRLVMQHQTDAMKAGLATHASVEASAYLAAEIQRNLESRLTQMESAGAIAQSEARGIRSAVSGDLALLQRSLIYADTAALGSVDSQARAARVDMLRARLRNTRVVFKVHADEKDSQLLSAVKDLPVVPSSLFGGRLFNAVEGIASGRERAEAASALVASLGKGYALKLEQDKAKGTKRPFPAEGTSGGPKPKKTKGSAQSSGNQSAGNQTGKQQPKSKPAAGRGKQQSTNAQGSGSRGRNRRRGGRGHGTNKGSGGKEGGKPGGPQ